MASRSGTPYRLAENPSSPSRTAEGLEELLRTRLRIATSLAAVVAGGLGLATLFSNLSHIRQHFWVIATAPPFAGPMILMAMLMAALWFRLTRLDEWTLSRLHVVEWSLAGVWAAFFVITIAIDLHNLENEIGHVPIDLAMAHSSMWGLLLVGYAVLIPSTPRQGTIRNAAFFACSGIPIALVLFSGNPLPPKLLIYAGTCSGMTLFYAVIATYGAYRIETLRRDAQAARQLGQYVLTRQLGSGGMGEVYLAEHRFLQRPCAVKLIRPERAGDATTLRRFEREAQATAALNHPNTIQIYDYGIAEDGTFFYVMEYLPGHTLEAVLESDGPLPLSRVVHILSQVCGALHEAHGAGLVHRDIKPGNVIIGDRGGIPDVAKLLDFGLVSEVHRGTHAPDRTDESAADLVVGTPAYMSPEQCGGDVAIGPASDIYSLGALTFALLTGESPFAGRTPIQMLAAHLYEVPRRVDVLRPELGAEIADVIARSLEKSPEQRFPDAVALGEALRQASYDG